MFLDAVRTHARTVFVDLNEPTPFAKRERENIVTICQALQVAVILAEQRLATLLAEIRHHSAPEAASI